MRPSVGFFSLFTSFSFQFSRTSRLKDFNLFFLSFALSLLNAWKMEINLWNVMWCDVMRCDANEKKRGTMSWEFNMAIVITHSDNIMKPKPVYQTAAFVQLLLTKRLNHVNNFIFLVFSFIAEKRNEVLCFSHDLENLFAFLSVNKNSSKKMFKQLKHPSDELAWFVCRNTQRKATFVNYLSQ